MYGPKYLEQTPTKGELRSIAHVHDVDGFPGCIGAAEVMKVHWKNCPNVHKGQYHCLKDGQLATIGVEACGDQNRYIWSWLGGKCETNKNKTMIAF